MVVAQGPQELQMEAFEAEFKNLDADGSGAVDQDEFGRLLCIGEVHCMRGHGIACILSSHTTVIRISVGV